VIKLLTKFGILFTVFLIALVLSVGIGYSGSVEKNIIINVNHTGVMRDTFVNMAAPTTNYGDDPQNSLRTKVDNLWREYFMFGIPEIAGKKVVNASFYQYLQTSPVSDAFAHIYHVYNWTGSNETTITWNNQPCGLELENTANCNATEESNLKIVNGAASEYI